MPSAASKSESRTPPVSPSADQGEQAFWRAAGASWRQLAGGFREAGFSFEWHAWEAAGPIDWSASFHPCSVELCLNLAGNGKVQAGSSEITYAPRTCGFVCVNGGPVKAERSSRERHEFITIEFSLPHLGPWLAAHQEGLHPLLAQALKTERRGSGVSEAAPLSNRQRELANALLRPPVLRSAQRLWYQSKALEFASEFFFRSEGSELLCSRAKRVASERAARAREILLANLAEPPSLEDLGRQVGCSHFYLSRIFTQETGMTITQWLRRERLTRAAELLRAGQCNVTEAALEVGYSSLSHFSQAFHEMFGCCPGLYPVRTAAQCPPQNPNGLV